MGRFSCLVLRQQQCPNCCKVKHGFLNGPIPHLPMTFLHWPHQVDDFGLLKWYISTFLAQDMRLTWLKIKQFGWQI